VPRGKGEVTFREWRFEVQCLFADPEDTVESTVITTIRRSLKGRHSQKPFFFKKRTEHLFGDISTNEMIMQEFFNAYIRILVRVSQLFGVDKKLF